MDLSVRARINEFEVVEREGVGLTLRVVIQGSESTPRVSLAGVADTFEWPADLEISFRMHEGEIAERLWALRGAPLTVALRIEAPDRSL